MSSLFSVFFVPGNLPLLPASHISHPAINPRNQSPQPEKLKQVKSNAFVNSKVAVKYSQNAILFCWKVSRN